MQAEVYRVTQKKRKGFMPVASMDDFGLTKEGAISEQEIVDSPNITLYCLDHRKRLVVFVETPQGIDLTGHPFYYQAQYEQAVRVIPVAYDRLPRLAKRAEDRHASAGLTAGPIMIYSVARAGSTLLGKALGAHPGAVTISEPDVLTTLVRLRNESVTDNGVDADAEEKLVELLRACLSLLYKASWAGNAAGARRVVIKLRSFCIHLAELVERAAPNSSAVFLYRNVEDQVNSSLRALYNLRLDFLFRRMAKRSSWQEYWLPLVPLLRDYMELAKRGKLSQVDFATIQWMDVVERYVELVEEGHRMVAIRYEDMRQSPEAVLRQLFAAVNLPGEQPSTLASSLAAFAMDSQEGTALSREAVRRRRPRELSEKQRARIHELVQDRSRLRDAAPGNELELLPGTIDV